MSKKIKIIIFFLLLIIVFLLFSFFINNYNNKSIIKKAKINFEQTHISNHISPVLDLSINIDGVNIIGFIKIEKINFEGLVYQGTSQDVLSKGVGHFECSPLTKRQYMFSGS